MLAVFAIMTACAQTAGTFELKIWDGTDNKDSDRGDAILYGYLPENSNGKAVVICPGGGYRSLSMDYEGTDFAKWLNEHDVAGFVLKYRLPAGRSEVPMADAEQAMKIVRQNAQKWRIDPRAIGIMGCSAGGHLASTLATHVTTGEGKADFQILLYPVITMNTAYTHGGSQTNLLGSNPTATMIYKYSNEKQVTAATPKAFVVVSAADNVVPVYNSLQYTQALIDKSIPVALHVYPGGQHGFGHHSSFKDYDIWHRELLYWMDNEVQAKVPEVKQDYLPDHSSPILKDVTQLRDNCHWTYLGQDFGVSNLLDNNKLTYFHSDAANQTPLSSLNQYIQMDLQEERSAFQLYFAGKAYGEFSPGFVTDASKINTPKHLVIMATNTPKTSSSWKKVAEIVDGFPGVCDGGEFWSEPIEMETPMRYIRMIVKEAEQSNVYWNISELQAYPCISTADGISPAREEKEGCSVCSMDGTVVRENTTSTEGLPRGIYVVGGRKVAVK